MNAETIANAVINGGGIVRTPNASPDLLDEVNTRYPDILIIYRAGGIYEFRPKPRSINIADDDGIAAYGERHKVYQGISRVN